MALQTAKTTIMSARREASRRARSMGSSQPCKCVFRPVLSRPLGWRTAAHDIVPLCRDAGAVGVPPIQRRTPGGEGRAARPSVACRWCGTPAWCSSRWRCSRATCTPMATATALTRRAAGPLVSGPADAATCAPAVSHGHQPALLRTTGKPGLVADWHAHRLDRAAVPRPVHERVGAAALVCPTWLKGAQVSAARSLHALRREQSGQHGRARPVSESHRTAPAAWRAEPMVGGGVRGVRARRLRVRRTDVAGCRCALEMPARQQRRARPFHCDGSFRWAALAFVPSSLMLAVTSYLSTDIAALPLLWTIPLSLYLLTFVVAFGMRSAALPAFADRTLPLLVLPLAVFVVVQTRTSLAFAVPLHLLVFTTAGLLCHGRLAADRPGAGAPHVVLLLDCARGHAGRAVQHAGRAGALHRRVGVPARAGARVPAQHRAPRREPAAQPAGRRRSCRSALGILTLSASDDARVWSAPIDG